MGFIISIAHLSFLFSSYYFYSASLSRSKSVFGAGLSLLNLSDLQHPKVTSTSFSILLKNGYMNHCTLVRVAKYSASSLIALFLLSIIAYFSSSTAYFASSSLVGISAFSSYNGLLNIPSQAFDSSFVVLLISAFKLLI